MDSNRVLNCKVRPNVISEDVLANEGMDMGEDQEEIMGEGIGEGRAIPRKNMVYEPTKAEWDEHCRTHIPFRAWCPCCVQGTSVSGIHTRTQKSIAERKSEISSTIWVRN